MFFGPKAAWRKERGPGGDDQSTVRAGERGAESFDGAPIDLAVGLEVRKVVDKRGVNHAIRGGCSTAQAFQVFKIPSLHLRAGGGKRFGAGIGPRQSEHLMARVDELLNNGGTDKSGGTGDENTHCDFSFIPFRDHDRICICGLVVIKMVIEKRRSSWRVRIIFAIVRDGVWIHFPMCCR